MHSLLLTKENLQTRIKPQSNDSVRHIRRQNTPTAGGAGLEPAARKHVVPTYLLLDHLPLDPSVYAIIEDIGGCQSGESYLGENDFYGFTRRVFVMDMGLLPKLWCDSFYYY
jgi:hypothetical protein